MIWPGAESVPVLRYQETGVDDRYGAPVSAWVALPEPLRCGVADGRGMVTQAPGREQVAFDYLLLLEPGQEVLTSDRLIVRGRSCEVVQPKFEWQGLFSAWNPGGTVYVKAVDG
ncbi:hypothetical protein SRABI26_02725 [Arthrobacter sp. Bi26]|uniref:hypothetical protein n=1 Tax=Arthrobacter sp. Bi26 TaxID=2822350 RepID=UPI001D2B6FE4|nr:hypothetical protein [Arthrobacter sp. Bi26]CAH0234022.1 hypothetical protein SRABI26_02725 [Arthrobacter sp. Bi26]